MLKGFINLHTCCSGMIKLGPLEYLFSNGGQVSLLLVRVSLIRLRVVKNQGGEGDLGCLLKGKGKANKYRLVVHGERYIYSHIDMIRNLLARETWNLFFNVVQGLRKVVEYVEPNPIYVSFINSWKHETWIHLKQRHNFV